MRITASASWGMRPVSKLHCTKCRSCSASISGVSSSITKFSVGWFSSQSFISAPRGPVSSGVLSIMGGFSHPVLLKQFPIVSRHASLFRHIDEITITAPDLSTTSRNNATGSGSKLGCSLAWFSKKVSPPTRTPSRSRNITRLCTESPFRYRDNLLAVYRHTIKKKSPAE